MNVHLSTVDVARAALEGEVTVLRCVLVKHDRVVNRERDRVDDLTAQLLTATVQAIDATGLQAELQGRLDAAIGEMQALRARP